MSQKGFAPILIVVLIALGLGGYLIYQKQTKPALMFQSSPSPVTSPASSDSAETSNPDLIGANWKTYTLNDASFKYPPTWNVIDAYTFKGDSNREGFTLKCSGPLLQDTENKTTLIAVESIKSTQTDGAFCWSIGEFKPGTKRSITVVNPPKEISISEWIPGVLVKYAQNEQAYLLFQTYNFNEFSKTFPTKNWHQFALIYEKGKSNTAEQTFDQILSTFKFTN